MYLASNLIFLMDVLLITKYQLSLQSGVNQHTTYLVCRGEGNPTLKSLLLWCDFFKVTLDELVLTDLSKRKENLDDRSTSS